MMKMETKLQHESQYVNKVLSIEHMGNHSVSMTNDELSSIEHKVTYQ
jgi:hypothetical protein